MTLTEIFKSLATSKSNTRKNPNLVSSSFKRQIKPKTRRFPYPAICFSPSNLIVPPQTHFKIARSAPLSSFPISFSFYSSAGRKRERERGRKEGREGGREGGEKKRREEKKERKKKGRKKERKKGRKEERRKTIKVAERMKRKPDVMRVEETEWDRALAQSGSESVLCRAMLYRRYVWTLADGLENKGWIENRVGKRSKSIATVRGWSNRSIRFLAGRSFAHTFIDDTLLAHLLAIAISTVCM